MRGIKRIAVAAVAVGVLTAGCGGGDKPIGNAASSNPSSSSSSGGGSTGEHKKGGTVTIANVGGQTWPCQFNPFNPAVNQVALGFVYEPLTFVNVLKAGATTPMLATAFTWSPKKDSIDFTIRDGVKWSDGQPFTADDVVYTFTRMKEQPALDLYSLWTGAGLTSVSAAGNKVTLKFKAAAEPYFFNFAGQVGIVPKHIWSAGEAASKPATWTDPKPVGTGPFTVESCSGNNISYVANPNYWQPGKPYVEKVQYPAYLDNNPANLDLASGKAQWGGQYIPNIDNFYKAKSPENNYWFPPTANVALVPNNDPSRPATSKLEVRQAIAYALDREQISKIGESGYQPAANQTGVVTPTFDKYFDKDALTAAGYDKPNLDKAKQLLQTAGYSESNPLKLNVITVTGYTDWDASLAVVKQQLAKVGIELTIQDLQQQSYNQKLYTGDYDLAYSSLSGGPSPYYELRQLLYSKNSAPIGKQANSNYSRYMKPEVDKLFDQYASADPDTQVKLIKQISSYMIKDVPIIPTTESVDWYQYNTKDLDGWPTQDDPYAQPAPYNIPDVGQVLTNLYSKSAQK
ncbi:peptide/nickel transport system substrate-binding protein [Kribbella sp. VKM Ac-2571]|uniref:ABC transporter substrate-binding protein n=1 Tax=Kribbella sp. VKM Ac-2571 TaxID=2512222 RepID=UPI001061132A|nr:ABC transporter substrate-binding protein [Kribbella sp. VKM Ac-2571]TDO58935.1 peptide/nickel transport system substrate-binding protein [Kribbella sp. VKM Ac-2571]